MRRRSLRSWVVGGCLAIGCVAGTAAAAPATVDVAVNIGASVSNARPALVPNGSTVTVTNRRFWVFVDVSLIAPVATTGTVRAELGPGLAWGSDAPDPSEKCVATPTSGTCDIGDLQPITGGGSTGWFWEVVAPQNGTYTFKAELVSLSDSDSDPSSNSSRITIVVDEQAASGGGGGGGGSSGGGASAKVSAGAIKLSPARPKAGSTVVASVRVTRGGSPVRPSKIACAASIGKTKVKGASRAASGVASCLFKTPRTAKGESLSGSVSFRAGGAAFTKRFATKLR